MDDGAKVISRSNINISAASNVLQDAGEIHQSCWIKNSSNRGRTARTCSRTTDGEWNRHAALRIIPTRPDNFVSIFEKPIYAEFFVIVQSELTDNRAERDLRRFHIHLVENFFYLHYHLTITQDDDGVSALVGDNLGIANGHGLRRGIDRLSRKFFRDIQVAAAGRAGFPGVIWIGDGGIGRALWGWSGLWPSG